MELYTQHINSLERYINGDNDLKTEIRHVVTKLVDRITVDHRHMITIQFKDGDIQRYMLLQRKDGKRIHQKYYSHIQLVPENDYDALIAVYPVCISD